MAWLPSHRGPVRHSCKVTPRQAPAEGATKQQEAPSSEQIGSGISAFLSRVLDQLSITSWLPAVFFVGNAAVLLALQGEKQLVLTKAIAQLVGMDWGALVVLVFAVIIAAVLIQAFEFENLRFWEGYVRSSKLNWWATWRVRAHEKKLCELERRYDQQQLAAFDNARQRALDDKAISDGQRAMWNALETVMHDRVLREGELDLADEAAARLDWPSHADPVKLREWDITEMKLAEYPAPHRVLPTRLGNVMRAAEDQVKLEPGEDLEGFMIRHMDALPNTIVSEHAAYRRRLEMYCGLMFVLVALALLSAVCFWGQTTDLPWRIGVPVLYAGAVWIGYKAAIASALGFGQALREASAWLKKASPDD